MTRSILLLLGFSLVAAAQAPEDRPVLPITGRVLNAATGEPIAGAVVHYRGDGISFDQHNHTIDPPTIQGEVRTGPDGSYTTPPLPSFGHFTIRAAASGFFGAKDYLQALPQNLIQRETPPLPPGIKRPPGYQPPPPHDGVLRLEPDPIDLRPMSDAALAAFALPLQGFSNRMYFKGAFSADAGQLRFVTLDSVADKTSITRRCRAWSYDLAKGVLTGTERPGSPYVARMQKPDMPPNFCPESEGRRQDNPVKSEFGIDENYSHDTGKGTCGKLEYTSPVTHRTQTIAPLCAEFSYRIDPVRDLVYYTQPMRTTTYPPRGKTENIVEFDLATGQRRAFSVPIMNYEPELLAEQSLPSGATRIAYTLPGDCDPAASDYSQPSQPDGVLGNTPNQFSVCFVTIPAESAARK